MLDLAKHIVNQKAGRFEPHKFEDQYETALVDQPEARRQADHGEGAAARRERGRPDGGAAAERGRGDGRDQGSKEAGQETAQGGGQKEMLMPIAGKKPVKEAAVERAKPQRKSA
jgi:DNA end-binding protein Ku